MDSSRLGARAVLTTLAACAGAVALLLVPLPGVDGEALAAFQRHGGGLLGLFDVGWSPPVVSLGAVGLVPLALSGLLRRLVAKEPDDLTVAARVTGNALLALLSLVAAVGLLSTLNAMGDAPGAGWVELVPPPFSVGWSLALVGLLGGAALLAALSELVTRRGVGHGPLVLNATWALVVYVGTVARAGYHVGAGEGAPLELLTALAGAVPFVVACVGVALGKRAYPVRIARGLAVLSPVDLVLAPAFVTALGESPTALAAHSVPSFPLGTTGHAIVWLLGFLLALGTATLAVVVAHRGTGGRRTLGLLAPAGLALVGAPVVALAALLVGRLAHPPVPSPYAGSATVAVTLAADGGDGRRDAPRIVSRLAQLGVEADVVTAGRGRIALRLHDVSGGAVMHEVLARRALSFHLVARDQSALHASPAVAELGLRTTPDYDGTSIPYAPDREGALALVARASLPPGTLVRVECRSGEAGSTERCTPWVLEPTPVLTDADVGSAVASDDEQSMRPVIALTFRPAGAARFARVTGESIHRKLAICVDDDLLSAPRIQTAIPGGRAQITLGTDGSPAELMERARSLAAALASGALGSTWQLESEANVAH